MVFVYGISVPWIYLSRTQLAAGVEAADLLFWA
jgi:hypothetical protein